MVSSILHIFSKNLSSSVSWAVDAFEIEPEGESSGTDKNDITIRQKLRISLRHRATARSALLRIES